MNTIFEINNGGLSPVIIKNQEKFYNLDDISHLLIDKISNEYYCITNSFKNRSFLVNKTDWHGIGIYPEECREYFDLPKQLVDTIDLPDYEIKACNNTTTFIIVLSYDCNLKCPYCYQQCNEKLDRNIISEERLAFILGVVEQYHFSHPEQAISIGLFGGEPLLPENYNHIIHIFDFCVKNRFSVSITTNGVNLPYYLKDLVIYSGLDISIGTTIDSISENEATRFSITKEGDSRSNSILRSVMTLINYNIHVHVSMNIDRHNYDEIPLANNFYQKNGFLDNPYFSLGIGIVDDRRYEIGYTDTIQEWELIEKLMHINGLHNHVFFEFVKAPLNLCKKAFSGFKQAERKHINNFCWASAPLDKAYYIDPDLDVFRCTYSVGRKECSLFKFSLEALENYKLPNRTYMDYPDCQKCSIGGFCSGGCALSAEVDFPRMCAEEKENFRSFLDNVYYPRVREMLDAFMKQTV